jgi:hypothetical protein
MTDSNDIIKIIIVVWIQYNGGKLLVNYSVAAIEN